MHQTTDRPRHTVNTVYPEALTALCALLDQALEGKVDSGCWFGTFYRWFMEDLELWHTRQETDHHLRAFGGMGSFNDIFCPEGFPGGEKAFDNFYGAYKILKEVSYHCAMILYLYRTEFPDQPVKPLRYLPNGTPVTVCTCTAGHRWHKEGLAYSYYLHHARQMSIEQQAFALLGDLGGSETMALLLRTTPSPEPDPFLQEMQQALDRAAVVPRPEDCPLCRKKKIPSKVQYLTGWPMNLTETHFFIKDCILQPSEKPK